ASRSSRAAAPDGSLVPPEPLTIGIMCPSRGRFCPLSPLAARPRGRNPLTGEEAASGVPSGARGDQPDANGEAHEPRHVVNVQPTHELGRARLAGVDAQLERARAGLRGT